jgi:hypothetical protein
VEIGGFYSVECNVVSRATESHFCIEHFVEARNMRQLVE